MQIGNRPSTLINGNGRVCTKCGIWKGFQDFPKHPKGISGRNPFCKECCYLQRRERNRRNRDFKVGVRRDGLRSGILKKCPKCKVVRPLSDFGASYTNGDGTQRNCKMCGREWHKTPRGRYKVLNVSAKQRGLTMTLTREQFLAATTDKSCTYCGEPLDNRCCGSNLDRMDNLGGYTPDNITPCCASCNLAKGMEFSYEEMLCEIGPAIRRVKLQRADLAGRLF